MTDKQTIIEKIRQAFDSNEYPGDGYLQGSREGCEPFEEVGPFVGRRHWQEIEPEFLDGHAAALAFFSEAGFRFFLPAYLLADLQDRLHTTDPLFHLTHGFSDCEVKMPLKNREFLVKSGKTALLNPRRYGAMTFYDHSCYRLSIFTREEAAAIAAYLQFRREAAGTDFEREEIDAALNSFWSARSRTAPSAADLQQHLAAEDERLAAMSR